MSDSPIFMCGKHGGVFFPDEHSKAGMEYAEKRNLEHHRKHGTYGTLDQHVEWAMEGEEASRRRADMRRGDPPKEEG